ncbi:hypothetical protein PanWU01x14_058000, partial [Parasponia andersonii]
MASLLRNKYFVNRDFLLAGSVPGASAIWQSLIWSKELLLKDCRWQIGTSALVRILRDL